MSISDFHYGPGGHESNYIQAISKLHFTRIMAKRFVDYATLDFLCAYLHHDEVIWCPVFEEFIRTIATDPLTLEEEAESLSEDLRELDFVDELEYDSESNTESDSGSDSNSCSGSDSGSNSDSDSEDSSGDEDQDDDEEEEDDEDEGLEYGEDPR